MKASETKVTRWEDIPERFKRTHYTVGKTTEIAEVAEKLTAEDKPYTYEAVAIGINCAVILARDEEGEMLGLL